MSIFNGANLPQELLINIFSRLPVKSIGQLRCVSNPLNSLLSDEHFLKTHFTNHFQEPEKIILLSNSHIFHTITFNKNCIFINSINFKQTPSDQFVEICGSCNGLVLILNKDGTKVVINPITLDFKIIPNSPLALEPYGSFSMHGFGYDYVNDDYKIVMISRYDHDNEVEPDILDMFMDIYSLKNGSWKRIKSSPYDHAVPEHANGVFVNGALHWLASKKPDYSSVIGAFVLSDEEFVEVPAPSSLDKDKFVFNKLVVLKGCLCMVDNVEGNRVDIWMMKDYGVEESWTKFCVDGIDFYDFLKPLCFMRDDEVVLNVDGEKLMVYNLEEEESRDLEVDGLPDSFESAGTFVESLVSPADPNLFGIEA
ncbi:F-box/kelch-repeat protein At3g06240-like [Lycium ferocissimum]|uniref:F-box/kelch-repeat protein At3g06240-like n=1 Tax=Lycium ferocissimum TaxID=112874 RepID=UPI0028154105|nr:F-box/kelch-repeat protein At3g06240-like [Lycium ferocissimum]